VNPFVADLSVLQEIVDGTAGFERSLDERLGELDARARRVQTTWSGAAAAEYAAAHDAWAGAARDLHAALGSLRRLVRTAQANYETAIAANRTLWP
jgi:WXG100 family type VII secretion target